MRKKTETAIKVLNEKIEKLEKELQNQRKVIEFLSTHDRNDIELIVPRHYGIRFMGECISARYIYKGALQEIKIGASCWVENESKELVWANVNRANVIENSEERFVVKVENDENLFEPKYYRVTKRNNEITLVSEYYQEPPTVANPDTPTTSCENCAKKSSCKLHNKVNFSVLMPKMIVCDEFTLDETDFKYFTAEQVRNMSQEEVTENYSDIMKSMKKW